MKKKATADQKLRHPMFGECVNVTPLDANCLRQRLSESGHTVVDVKCADGQERVLLLSSFVPESPPSPSVVPAVEVPEQKTA